MFIDVLQLRLEKPPAESDDGIPLAALGKYLKKKFIFLLLYYLKDVEHVLILINNKIIYFLLVQKKEKFINVQNHIIINFWIHTMLIIWLFMLYVGIHFIQKYLLVVQLIGLLKFGILIISTKKKDFFLH